MTMRNTWCAILLVGWSFAGLPVLCEAGEIAHACDCTPGALCEHENECPSDPCHGLTANNESRGRDEPVPMDYPAFSMPHLSAEIRSDSVFIFGVTVLFQFRLPYPPSVLPLRI
ncbi:MAG: hypothetical protein HOP29_06215 [Phycisphaerales bacterium]|nr:hypothetical protein [Phycisphaerales bacterium]